MTIFATLPVEVRRALARQEMRRRGLTIAPPQDDTWSLVRGWVPTAALEALHDAMLDEAADGTPAPTVGPTWRHAAEEARTRMLASRGPLPPRPPVVVVHPIEGLTANENHARWMAARAAIKDHDELDRLGLASDEALAAVDRLLADLAH